MLMIVAHHYSIHGIRHISNIEMNNIWQNGSIINKTFTSFLINGGEIGNGIFFMLTGFFMFGKEFQLKKILKLLGEVYFYSIFYLIIYIIIKFFNIYNFPELSIISQMMLFIKVFIPITSGSWWFIQTYCVLFLFIPVLNKFVNKISSKRNDLLILFLIWIFWLVPKIFGFSYSNFQMAVFFYILGAELNKTKLNINKWLSLLLFCVIWILLTFIDTKNSQILKNENIKEMLIKLIYNCITTAILTPLAVVFIFEFFKRIQIHYSKFINIIASTTFGVYLIHDSTVGRELIWNKIFHCLDFQYNSKYFPIFAFGSIIIVFIVCSIIDFFRQVLFEKKYMSLINKILSKIKKNNIMIN